jgi:hypothetical protein
VLVAGVYVALTKIDLFGVTILKNLHLSRPSSDAAFPVKVPTTEIEPSEQTDAEDDEAVTPLKPPT